MVPMSENVIDTSKYTKDRGHLPVGAREPAERIASGGGGGRGGVIDTSRYGQPQRDARGFYTGRNLQGQGNGWDNEFISSFHKNYSRSVQEGDPSTINWFREKRDGIALWDDEEYGIKFGDVFRGGRKVENLYDAYGQEFADNVMRPFVMNSMEQLKGTSVEDKRKEATKRAAEARAAGGNQNDARYYRQQKEFGEKVDKEKDSWDQGTADAWTTGSGIAGGALTGAGLGAIFGPIGAGIGAAAGAAVGGIAAWMNRDEIQDQYARGQVKEEMSREAGSIFSKASTSLQTWSGLAAQQMNPFGNLVHGLADTEGIGWGSQGDRQSAYYETDETGQLKRSVAWTAADMGGLLLSSVGQFATGAGMVAFQSQMSAMIGGKVGELTFTGGQSFDDRTAEFDNIFTDEEGNFDLASSAAGLGVVGIDVAQLGLARGLGSSAGAMGRGGQWGKFSWLTGTKAATAPAAGKAGSQSLAGWKFDLDAAGNAVKARMSATALAPSEFVQYGSVRVAALMARGAGKKGVLTPDEIYRKAVYLSRDAKVVPAALINGWGEGAEEAVQAMLEPISHNQQVDWGDVGQSALMGFAMGAGMTIGSRVGTKRESQDYDKAQVIMGQLGQSLSREQWDQLSTAERKSITTRYADMAKTLAPVAEELRGQMFHQVLMTEPMAQRQLTAASRLVAAQQKSANPGTDQATVVTQLSPGWHDHSMVLSVNTLERFTAASTEALAEAVEVSRTDEERTQLTAVLEESQQILRKVRAVQAAFYDSDDAAVQRNELLGLNRWLEARWKLRGDDPDNLASAQAMTALMMRPPVDNPASVVGLLPQVGLELSMPRDDGDGARLGTGDNMVEVSLAWAAGNGMDFDGDKLMHLTKMVMSPEVFRSIRSGAYLRTMEAGGDKHRAVNMSVTEVEKGNIGVLGAALREPQGATRSEGEAVISNMRAFLKQELSGWGADSAIEAFLDDLALGDADARPKFFDVLATEFEHEVLAYGRERWESVYTEINSRLRQELWTLQMGVSASNSDSVEDMIQPTVYNVVEAESRVGGLRTSAAATASQTEWMLFAGDSMFRAWQSLNYASNRSNEEPIGERMRGVFMEMAQTYAALNSAMVNTRVEMLNSVDDVSLNVTRRLEAFLRVLQREAGTSHMSLAVLANMAVPRLVMGPEGELTQQGMQSVTQWFLGEELESIERKYPVIPDSMKAKHARLRSADADQAFVEMFGAYTMNDIVGIDGDVFGGNLTISQVYAQLVNQDSHGKKMASEVLHRHSSYMAKDAESGKHNMPFEIPKDGTIPLISPYQSMVDAIVGASNKELTYDGNQPWEKQLGGRLGKADARNSLDFQGGITKIWQEVRQDKGFDHKNRDHWVRLLETNQEIADGYFAVLSDNAAVVAIDSVSGTSSPFLIDALMADNAAEAEFIFWRGMLLSEWNALGAKMDEDGTPRGRSFYDMKNRWHLLMYRLAQRDRLLDAAAFDKALAQSKTLPEFLAFVNNQDNGLRGMEAPYLAWHSDVAEIDPTARQGELTSMLPSTETRTAISEFHRKAGEFVTHMARERQLEQQDRLALKQLRDAIANEKKGVGKDTALQGVLDTLRARLRFSLEFKPSFSPAAMNEVVAGNLLWLTRAVDKGIAPTHVQSLGAFEMLNFMREFGTPEEARMASIGAGSLSQLLKNPSKLVDPMELMDDAGNTIHWPGLSAETIVELWNQVENRPLLRSMFFPSVYDAVPGGRVEQRFLTSGSLSELIDGDTLGSDLFGDTRKSKALYASVLDGATGGFSVLEYSSNLATAMTSASLNSIQSGEQAYELSSRAMVWTGELVRTLAPLARVQNTGPNAMTVDVTQADGSIKTLTPPTMLDVVRLEKKEQLRSRFGTEKHSKELHTILQLAEQDIRENADMSDPLTSQQAFDQLALLEDAANDRILPRLIATYSISNEDAENPNFHAASAAKRAMIERYIEDGSVLSTAFWSGAVRKAMAQNVDPSTDSLDLEPAEWAELSRVVLVHALQQRISTTTPGRSLTVVKDATTEALKYLDPAREWVLDIADSDHPMIKAALRIQDAFNKKFIVPSVLDASNLLDRTVLNEDEFGPLDSTITENMMQAKVRIAAAAAGLGIAGGGSVPKTHDAENFASRRTYDVPGEDLLSTVELTGQDLEVESGVQVTRPGGQASPAPSILLDGRFARSVRANVAGTDVSSAPHLHLLENSMLPFTGTEMAAQSGYGSINRRRLMLAARAIAKDFGVDPSDVNIEIEFFHPDDAPVTMANNLFFEGVIAEGDHAFASLPAAENLAVGGTDQLASTKALGAQKNLTSAIGHPALVGYGEAQAARTGWRDDIAATARTMALKFMEPDGLGEGERHNPAKFNSQVKRWQMRLAVKQVVDGELQTLSFEQVRELQRNAAPNNPALDPSAELVVISDDGLRKLHGSPDDWTIGRNPAEMLTSDWSTIESWTGEYTDAHRQRLPGLFEQNKVSVFTGKKNGRMVMRELGSFEFLNNDKLRKAARNFTLEAQMQVDIARVRDRELTDSDRKAAAQQAVTAGLRKLDSRAAAEALTELGLPYKDGSSDFKDLALSTALNETHEWAKNRDARLAHVYNHVVPKGTSPSTKVGMIYGIKGLMRTGKPKASWVAPHDLTVVNLDSFDIDDADGVTRVISTLMGYGSDIILSTDGTRKELETLAKQLISEGQYKRLPGSNGIYHRVDMDGSPVTYRATYDQLTEMGPVSFQHIQAFYQNNQLMQLEENMGVVFPESWSTMKVLQRNLLPIATYPNFGLATANAVRDLNADVRTDVLNAASQLKKMNQKLDTQLKKLEKRKDKAAADRRRRELDAELDRAINKLHSELGPDGLYPSGTQLELGDIIPLIDSRTGRVILYRHGSKAPSSEQMRDAFSAGRMVLYSPELDQGKTAHTGEIVSFDQHPNVGLSAQLRVPIQALGQKTVLDETGFKLIQATGGDNFTVELPPLTQGLRVAGMIQLADSFSKSNFGGVVNNFQNAFLYLGIDFRPELARFLFGDDSAASQSRVASSLDALQRELPKFDKVTVDRLMKEDRPGEALLSVLEDLGAQATLALPADTLANLKGDPSAFSPETRIGLAMLKYLSWHDARPSDILYSAGVGASNARQSGVYGWKMPAMFTQIFDNTDMADPLRLHALEKVNNQLYVGTDVGTDSDGKTRNKRVGWRIRPDFTVVQSNKDAKATTTSGYLQFIDPHSAATNVETDAMASDRVAQQGVFPQLQQVFGATTGARLSISKDLGDLAPLLNRSGLSELQDSESVFRMLRGVRSENVLLEPHYGPKALAYRMENREAAITWRRPLDTDGWEKNEIDQYVQARLEVARILGFTADEAEIIDGWVRQQSGHPTLSKRQMKRLSQKELEELTRSVQISHETAMNELKLVKQNVQNNLLPTVDGSVRTMHPLDLAALHSASQRTGWGVKRNLDDPASITRDWSDWVHINLAVGDVKGEFFDPMYLAANDAMRHAFADIGHFVVGRPLSSDPDMAERLLNEESDSLLSMSPHRARMLLSPEPDSVTWMSDPTTWTAHKERRRNIHRWRKQSTNGGIPAGTTVKDLVLHGVRLVDDGNRTSAFLRIATHQRALLALLNPALVVYAPFEGALQNIVEEAANLITGDSSIMWDTETRRYAKKTYSHLGASGDFRSMVNNEFKMDTKYSNAGRYERAVGKMAEFAGKIQDPYYGMFAHQVARRYVETVVRAAASLEQPLDRTYILDALNNNPRWAQETQPGLHMLAMSNLKNIKSVKATTLSLAWRHLLDPLTSSPRMSVAVPATLFVKLPLMFANYGFNTAVRMMGLQGVDAWLAAWLSGREKGRVNRAWSRVLDGISGTDTDRIEGEDVYDYGDVLESVDLAHAFVKGGVSLTSLFGLGMAAGALGLTGEDEEDRRRRRAAKYMGVPYLYDPRDIVNDFRSADAVYLDNISGLSEIFRVLPADENGEDGRSKANMNFVLKQVVSPLLGMQRFFQNGNPYEILWGFEDAYTSLPLVNTMGWHGATDSYVRLMAEAEKKAGNGDPADMPEVYRLMLNAVFTLERMLMESSFANQIYIGTDTYDRDPWKIIDKTGTGETRTNRLGLPEPTDALHTFENDEGELQQGYRQRTWLDAQLHSYSENRLGFALLAELGTRGKGDFLRDNMAVKTYKVENKEITAEEAYENISYEMADGVVRAMWKGGVSPEDLNLEGFYMTRETRQQLSDRIRREIYDEALAAGMSSWDANAHVRAIWQGPQYDSTVPGLEDIIWSKNDYEGTISSKPFTEYRQLNTGYVEGPDGNFWATGVNRSLMNTLGQLMPLQKYLGPAETGLPVDSRLNTTDPLVNVNTGLRGVERVDPSEEAPEFGDFKEDGGQSPYEYFDNDKKNGWQDFGKKSGWRNFGKRSGWRNFGKRRYGGGGGGGSFTRLNAPERSQTPYSNTIQNVNADNPIIRRATIRRERGSSQRGRLKPWQ